jgi:hypothetical protein
MSDVLDWSTGGLETMTFTALGAALALALFGAPGTSSRREWLAGALGALLVATRADGVLLAAALAGAFLARRSLRARRLEWPVILRVAAPMTLTLLALTAWRLRYYGDPLPNTFYAKSAGQGYAAQGLTYVGLLLARDWGLPALVLSAFAASAWRRLRAKAGPLPAPEGAAPVLLAAAVFAAYVVRSGGDFMFARRLVPLVPLAFMAAERALVPAFAPAVRTWMGLVAVVAMSLPYPLYERFGEAGRIARVSDERTFYPDAVVSFRKAQGAALAEAFRGIDTTFVAVDKMSVGGGMVQLGVLFYDEPIMQALARRPGVALVPIGAVLEQAKQDVRTATCSDAKGMLAYLDSFYFRWTPGAAPHRSAFARSTEERCAEPRR